MSPTPVATQEGEIDFSAYNAAGWREIVEYLNRTIPVSEWQETHGQDAVFAGGKSVPCLYMRAAARARLWRTFSPSSVECGSR
jgi:hypothetical protein